MRELNTGPENRVLNPLTNTLSMRLIRCSFQVLFVLIPLLVTSCITNKKLTYLQYAGTPPDSVASVTPVDYKIQPFDNIYIRVVTPDPQWSNMFNTVQASSAGSTITEQSADLISYSVDGDGNISMPYVGSLHVGGKILREIKIEVETALKAYITDAAVTVKMINNYINIIGEVNKPGRYQIYKDRMNIFQALAMAGDLGTYSDRMRVQIIRQIPEGTMVKEFSLNDRSILTSDFFYIMPNDVIYAKPIAGKFFKMDSFPYGVVLSAITTLILFLNVIQ
jgi:polysaccharide biosynthesis/export protein